MASGTQELFANLAEKEKLRGHHSPEGLAMRVLCRAMNGWSTDSLGAEDVLILCDQAVADWLRTRLKISSWSGIGFTHLLVSASERNWISGSEALRLRAIHEARSALQSGAGTMTDADIEAGMMFCIDLIDKRW